MVDAITFNYIGCVWQPSNEPDIYWASTGYQSPLFGDKIISTILRAIMRWDTGTCKAIWH